MIDRTDEQSKRSGQACLDNALQGGGRRESTKDEKFHEMLNSGEMYDSVDDEFIAYQHELVQRLNDFNRTDETPEGLKERDEILKEICGTYGEDLYVIPPVSANCGLRHVHFGKRVVVNFGCGFRARPWTIWGQIVVAAVAGVAVEYLLHRSLGLPMAVGMTIAVVAMLMSFRRFKPFAPAMAIVIVPALLPDVALLWFPLAAALGSGWFILSGMLLSRSGSGNEQDERNTSANHWKVIINRINTALHGVSRKTAMKQPISASRWG